MHHVDVQTLTVGDMVYSPVALWELVAENPCLTDSGCTVTTRWQGELRTWLYSQGDEAIRIPADQFASYNR